MTHEAGDFVLGDEVTNQVQRAKSPGLVVSARLERGDATKLMAIAKETNRTLSQVTREAVQRYIAEAENHRAVQIEATWTSDGVLLAPQPLRKTYGSVVDVVAMVTASR